MGFEALFMDVARNANKVFSGFCRNMDRAQCYNKITSEITEGFADYGVNVQPFLNYSLYAMENATHWHDGKPFFEGNVDLVMEKIDMRGVPEVRVDPVRSLDELTGLGVSYSQAQYWLYSINVGKFYLPMKEDRSGFYSYSYENPTLGNFNYGFTNFNEFIFHNDLPTPDPDEGCEFTGSKKMSLKEGKFECVGGHRWTNETVNEIEIFAVKNPGFEREEVFFLEPRIPYKALIEENQPLYMFPLTKFYNPPKKRYGMPMTLKEQNTNTQNNIVERLINYCLIYCLK